jgi:pyrroloquinoline quinone (PQQ) biosynthesis protein C
MIVGTAHYSIAQDIGSIDQFLKVKRYFDGRHSISDIAELTGVDRDDIIAIVTTFADLGLFRQETPEATIPTQCFVHRVNESCDMWRRQIGFHRLFSEIESGTARKEVFLGLVLETFHYVNSAADHISTAISHCTNLKWRTLLIDYLIEEHDHSKLFVDALNRMGLDPQHVTGAHPIIGTMSLRNMMCEIARESTLAYIACTSLIEARARDYEAAKTSMEQIATHYGYPVYVLEPILLHMEGDIQAGHSSMLEEALSESEYITAEDAHIAVNCLHDLKHSFDQFHDQILQYYSDISNYIPRLKVDYFSL